MKNLREAQFIKKIIALMVLVTSSVMVNYSDADAASECHAGWGKKVTKIAGLSKYPAECRSTVCHVATHEASLVNWEGFPPQPIVYFHYKANGASGIGLPGCPADVNAATFQRP
jgi:hypothetical protein